MKSSSSRLISSQRIIIVALILFVGIVLSSWFLLSSSSSSSTFSLLVATINSEEKKNDDNKISLVNQNMNRPNNNQKQQTEKQPQQRDLSLVDVNEDGILSSSTSSSLRKTNNININKKTISPTLTTSIMSSEAKAAIQRKQLYDIRSNVVLNAKAVSNIDSMLKEQQQQQHASSGGTSTANFHLGSLCSSGPGFPQCRSQRNLKIELSEEETNSNNNNNNSNSNNDEPLGQKKKKMKKRIRRGCCRCSWTPNVKACSGTFNKTNKPLLTNVVYAHYAHSPTSDGIPSLQQAATACPFFDGGSWNLPENFLDLNLRDAATASVRAGDFSFQNTNSNNNNNNDKNKYRQKKRKEGNLFPVSEEEIDFEIKHRQNIGPLLVWKLGRKLRELKTHETFSSSDSNSSSKSSSSSNPSSPGMLLISGDSHIRQLFARLIHTIRSRECTDINEMFRGGVFERYFHLSAAYIVTTRGDALLLDWPACEKMATEPHESSMVYRGARVLLRVCYVWDNTNDASNANFGTEWALNRIATAVKDEREKNKAVSAVIFWPTMHHCNYQGGKCQSANMSNGAVMTVLANALKYDIPRVLTSTTITRTWYPYYPLDIIGERNQQLKDFFEHNCFDEILEKKLLNEEILSIWRNRNNANTNANNNNNKNETRRKKKGDHDDDDSKKNSKKNSKIDNNNDMFYESVEKSLYFSMSPTKNNNNNNIKPGSRFRLYDYATRHENLKPRQCDHGHSMCMFWPLRTQAGVAPIPVNGLSGVCPNGSRCEDPWNFLILHEILALLFL